MTVRSRPIKPVTMPVVKSFHEHDRETLARMYGVVWTRAQLLEEFVVLHAAAETIVRRKRDAVWGYVVSDHGLFHSFNPSGGERKLVTREESDDLPELVQDETS